MKGFLTVLACGLLVLVVAALHDRRERRRRERALDEAVPPLPGIPDDAPRPTYVRPETLDAATAVPFTRAEREVVEAWQQGATRIEARLADEGLATHLDPPTAVLHDALVLVCPEPVTSMRLLLPTAERAVREGRALLVAASELDADVVETLRVNLRAGRLVACAVVADADACAVLAEATDATPVGRAELMSGAVPTTSLGRAPRVVVDAEATWVGQATD